MAAILSVGARETIMTPAQRVTAGVQYFPDGALCARKSGSVYTFFGAQGGVNSGEARVVKAVGTLANPVATSATPIAISTGSGLDYLAGGPVYEDPVSGALLMLAHGETWLSGGGATWTAECRLCKSTDGGDSWTDLGVIIRADDATLNGDMDGFPFVQVGDYWYAYFEDILTGPTVISFAVARTDMRRAVAAAVSGSTTTWNKYNAGTWTEAGVGGTPTTLEAGNPSTGFADVKWSQFTQTYWRIVTDLSNGSFLYVHESSDGLTWPAKSALTGEKGAYPSIIGVGDDPSIIDGPTFWIYYLHLPDGTFDWTKMELARRLVTVDGSQRKVAWCR
jgi:hypothetical protein